MPKFTIVHYYEGKEGFEVEADTPEQAMQMFRNGRAGQRDFDEYLRSNEVQVWNSATIDTDLEPALTEEE